jgi:hypothetical protein
LEIFVIRFHKNPGSQNFCQETEERIFSANPNGRVVTHCSCCDCERFSILLVPHRPQADALCSPCCQVSCCRLTSPDFLSPRWTATGQASPPFHREVYESQEHPCWLVRFVADPWRYGTATSQVHRIFPCFFFFPFCFLEEGKNKQFGGEMPFSVAMLPSSKFEQQQSVGTIGPYRSLRVPWTGMLSRGLLSSLTHPLHGRRNRCIQETAAPVACL